MSHRPFLRVNNSPVSTSGETIPIRLFLGGFELTPTFRDVNKKFSTRYYLNLVLIDEENRRYFKYVPRSPLATPQADTSLLRRQQEITVYRQDTREDALGPPVPTELGQHLETVDPDRIMPPIEQ